MSPAAAAAAAVAVAAAAAAGGGGGRGQSLAMAGSSRGLPALFGRRKKNRYLASLLPTSLLPPRLQIHDK